MTGTGVAPAGRWDAWWPPGEVPPAPRVLLAVGDVPGRDRASSAVIGAAGFLEGCSRRQLAVPAGMAARRCVCDAPCP